MTIKGLSEPMLDALRQRAEANRRSVNREIIAILEAAVLSGEPAGGDERAAWQEFGRRADAFRERMREKYGTLSDSTELIREARDER